MRLLVDLQARATAEYDTAYHDKLRGRVWRALEGTKFDAEHDSGESLGLTFSNVFPWGELSEGAEYQVLFASPREDLLAALARGLQRDREFNVGEMPFRVTDMTALDVDVGEPGTRGVIETATGVVVRLYDHHREEYGIDEPDAAGDSPTYWRPDHSIEPFRDALQENLQGKHERFAPEYVPGPDEVDADLFEGFDLQKTYALPVTVTSGVEITAVLSKWRLRYRVRDDTHRRHLNLALNTGIGGRNGLGFGFVNVVERTAPGESELEGTDALA
jgi:CRISPR-associated endoribonuclease Cas6